MKDEGGRSVLEIRRAADLSLSCAQNSKIRPPLTPGKLTAVINTTRCPPVIALTCWHLRRVNKFILTDSSSAVSVVALSALACWHEHTTARLWQVGGHCFHLSTSSSTCCLGQNTDVCGQFLFFYNWHRLARILKLADLTTDEQRRVKA